VSAVGSLTLVQTDGQFSTSGGKLNFPAQTTPAWGDQVINGAALARTSGRAFFVTVTFSTGSSSWEFGWANNPVGIDPTSIFDHGINFSGPIYLYARDAAIGAQADLGATFAGATTYNLAAVLRSTGAFLLIKGGAYSTWTLLWVEATVNTATTSPAVTNYADAGTLDDLRVVDLPAPWNTDYGIATTRLAGARSPGDTFTHTADCLVEITDTTRPSASNLDLRFRQQDASNYWQVTVDSTGALTLNEVVAGTPTQRGTAAAAVANGNRVIVLAVGSTIRVYSANVLKITYSSASNFAAATSGVLTALGTSGVVNDLVAWPRNPTIPAPY
jgi:hypothetical protein